MSHLGCLDILKPPSVLFLLVGSKQVKVVDHADAVMMLQGADSQALPRCLSPTSQQSFDFYVVNDLPGEAKHKPWPPCLPTPPPHRAAIGRRAGFGSQLCCATCPSRLSSLSLLWNGV